jgi:hypothetical protein
MFRRFDPHLAVAHTEPSRPCRHIVAARDNVSRKWLSPRANSAEGRKTGQYKESSRHDRQAPSRLAQLPRYRLSDHFRHPLRHHTVEQESADRTARVRSAPFLNITSRRDPI